MKSSDLDSLSNPAPVSYMLGGKHVEVGMFVVRFKPYDAEFDSKAFTAFEDAKKHFEMANLKVDRDEIESASLFEVVGVDDARLAVDAVKNGHASILRRDDRWNKEKAHERLMKSVL